MCHGLGVWCLNVGQKKCGTEEENNNIQLIINQNIIKEIMLLLIHAVFR